MLAVAAHPDDIESWCAGTLGRSIDAGATARLLLVTSGDKGTDDPTLSAAEVAQQREGEALEAARRLGLAEVAFLRYPDGEVDDTRALRGALVAAFRRWRPEVLFTHDPEHPNPPYLTHRDHLVLGRAALDAAYPLARDHLSFPAQAEEGLRPHAVRQVWLFASTGPSVYVDITAGFERKVSARLAHVSQTRDAEALRVSWRERSARIGVPWGSRWRKPLSPSTLASGMAGRRRGARSSARVVTETSPGRAPHPSDVTAVAALHHPRSTATTASA